MVLKCSLLNSCEDDGVRWGTLRVRFCLKTTGLGSQTVLGWHELMFEWDAQLSQFGEVQLAKFHSDRNLLIVVKTEERKNKVLNAETIVILFGGESLMLLLWTR